MKLISGFPWASRQMRAKDLRSHSKEEFVSGYGGDKDIAAYVWEDLREYCSFDDFHPSGEDSFLDMYGLCDGDLDDFAERIFRAIDIPWPSSNETRGMKSVETVDDMIRFIAHFRTGSAD